MHNPRFSVDMLRAEHEQAAGQVLKEESDEDSGFDLLVEDNMRVPEQASKYQMTLPFVVTRAGTLTTRHDIRPLDDL